MRWDGQRIEGDGEQALLGIPGLLRSVRSPEFNGVTFHEVRARSVLNKVPATSTLPFSWTINPYRGCSHACTYCLAGDTPILMADGRTKELGDIKVGDLVYGTKRDGAYRRYVPTEVLAHWPTVKFAYRVLLEDGTELVASGDHRFLSDRGWKYVTGTQQGRMRRPHLTTGNRLMGTGKFAAPPDKTEDYTDGYLCGTSGAGRGFHEVADLAWQKGFLAGLFDADGTYARGSVWLTNLGPTLVELAAAALRGLEFRFTIEESGRDTGLRKVRILGGRGEQLRFFHTVDPSNTRKRAIDGMAIKSPSRLRVRAIEPMGIELPLFDMATGTGDFIANGVVSHNCFARNTHTYLDFDAGEDFNSQVVVKVNAPEVLTAQLRKPSWQREHVAMGTNTDPYQRAEGRYQLMPRIIKALADSGTPFSILTKGTVLTRDLPLLGSVRNDLPISLGVSIALLDRDLQRRLEPGTPSPQARLELVRRAREAGLPCTVMIAPVLPGLTDSAEQLDALLAAVADAGATSANLIPLHLRPGAREWFAEWLVHEYPELVPRYRQIYARGSYPNRDYRETLSARAALLLRGHGLDRARRTEDAPPADIPAPRAPAVPEQLPFF